MQTYLPYPNFYLCANALDNKRLNNQRNECFVILDLLLQFQPQGAPWANHPVIKMWRGYRNVLAHYLQIIHNACGDRGIAASTDTHNRVSFYRVMASIDDTESEHLPPWMGGFIHENHRAKLLFKDPEYYSQFNWKEEPDGRSWYPVAWGRKGLEGYGDHAP